VPIVKHPRRWKVIVAFWLKEGPPGWSHLYLLEEADTILGAAQIALSKTNVFLGHNGGGESEVIAVHLDPQF
jgi:hypothetical protein